MFKNLQNRYRSMNTDSIWFPSICKNISFSFTSKILCLMRYDLNFCYARYLFINFIVMCNSPVTVSKAQW